MLLRTSEKGQNQEQGINLIVFLNGGNVLQINARYSLQDFILQSKAHCNKLRYQHLKMERQWNDNTLKKKAFNCTKGCKGKDFWRWEN